MIHLGFSPCSLGEQTFSCESCSWEENQWAPLPTDGQRKDGRETVHPFLSEGAVDNWCCVGLILLWCVCYIPIRQAMVNDIQMKAMLAQHGRAGEEEAGGECVCVCVWMQPSRCKQ